MRKSKLLPIILFLSSHIATFGVPAKPTPIIITQPDGSELTVYLRGDENHHFYITQDGYLINQDSLGFYCYATTVNSNTIVSSIRANDITDRTEAEISYISQIDKEAQFNQLSNLRNSKIAARQSAARMHAASTKTQKSGSLSTGTRKGLVILVEYQDVKFHSSDPYTDFERMMNLEGYNENGASGSARDYYMQTSNGAFTPHFDVYGPITLKYNMSYYGSNINGDDTKPEEMVIEACEQLNSTIDFSEYDLDEDGYIDNIFIFYAGYGEADGGPKSSIWPHAWKVLDVAGKNLKFDGKTLNGYACSNELSGGSGYQMVGIGTFCHEFGHVLGLPDMYATSYSTAFTPGYWEIMDVGSYNGNGKVPPNMSVYSRYALGWIEPKEINLTDTTFVLKSIDHNEAYIINTENENEYFLFENRQQSGWDTHIPYHGMLIWHIDYDEASWYKNTVNNTASHQRIDIEEADNIRTESSVRGDCFPGMSNITSFTDYTLPGMKSWSGREQNKPITNIKEQNGIIYFNALPQHTSLENVFDNVEISTKKNLLCIENGNDKNIYINIFSTVGEVITSFEVAKGESTILYPALFCIQTQFHLRQ